MPIPTDFSIPVRMTAKKRAFTQIQSWIIDGTLQPNEKLNDADLAQALGVSRTPIREALQLLNVQGFVEMFPGVGTQVTPVKKEDVKKILPPLGVLQALASELAAPLITQEVIDTLRDINRRFAEAIHDGDLISAIKLDEKFHNIIVENAQNQYITNSVSMLQAHVFRLFFHDSIIVTEKSVAEHEEILKAFEKKDKEGASAVSRTNWLRILEMFEDETSK